MSSFVYNAFPRTEADVDGLDMSFIKDAWNAEMLRDAIRAVVRVERSPDMLEKEYDVWKFISTYDPSRVHVFRSSYYKSYHGINERLALRF